MFQRRTPSPSAFDLDDISPRLSKKVSKTITELTAEENEQYQISEFFDHENSLDREEKLAEAMETLALASNISEKNSAKKYFAFLEQVRKSAYFLALQDKFTSGKKLSAGEYMYFALTTNDVNALDPAALREMAESYSFDNFTANINVLIAALEWQQAKENPDQSAACNKLLKEALVKRGSARGNCETYMNLHGIDLSGADLSMSSLDYTDLGYADLSDCNLYDTHIVHSNLDYALLRYTNCVRPDLQGRMEKGPTIKHTSAQHADFINMQAPNVDWQNSDFTGSSFENANIGPGCYTNTRFNRSNFSCGSLVFARNYMTNACSLKGADFSAGKIVDADYSKLDLIGTKIFTDNDLRNIANLQQTLDAFNRDLLDPLRNAEANAEYFETEITARKIMIADCLVDQITKLDGVSVEVKADLFDLALDHHIVQPEKLLLRMANTADRGFLSIANTLFSDHQRNHACYATPAMQKLEAARDQLIQSPNTPRM